MLIFNLLTILGCFALVAFMPVGAFIVMLCVTSFLFIHAAYEAGLKA